MLKNFPIIQYPLATLLYYVMLLELLRRKIKLKYKFITFLLLLLVLLPLIYFQVFLTNRQDRPGYLLGLDTVEGWSINTTRNASVYIQPENLTTILLPTRFCKSPTSLLVVVCSSPANFDLRRSIRETWGNTRGISDFSIRVYFLIGETSNSSLQYQIEEEFFASDDLVQEHFVDSYNNLTIKSLMMLKLIQTHCLNTIKYAMKTDDDMYVNMVPLIGILKRSNANNLLAGYLMKGVIPERDPTSKWYAPYYLFPEHYYPNYLSGTGYVMSIDVVPRLYNASLGTPIYYVEDVYITGILSRKIFLSPKNNRAFTYLKRSFNPCVYLTAVTSHRLNQQEIRNLFSIINTPHVQEQCKKKVQTKHYQSTMVKELTANKSISHQVQDVASSQPQQGRRE